MNLFDILGPVMVGPSSSHTAGAVRLGLACRTILGDAVKEATITFYGSFADTYRGHGTDKAVVGGLLGFLPDDEMVRESLHLAEFRGLHYEFKTLDNPRFHPNTVSIQARSKDAEIQITGASIGGGSIILTGINGFEVKVSCKEDTLVIFHRDTPGLLADLSYHLSMAGYNISNLSLTRTRREGAVVTVVETDAPVEEKTLQLLRQVGSVSGIVVIPKF